MTEELREKYINKNFKEEYHSYVHVDDLKPLFVLIEKILKRLESVETFLTKEG